MKPKPNYIEYERTIYQESLHRDYPTLQHALYPLHAGRCRIRGYPFETYKQPAAACQAYEGFPNPVHGIYLTEENYVYGDLCLNAEGMVLSNGDLSYARQREHALCPCGKLMQYLRMTLKKRQKERLYE